MGPSCEVCRTPLLGTCPASPVQPRARGSPARATWLVPRAAPSLTKRVRGVRKRHGAARSVRGLHAPPTLLRRPGGSLGPARTRARMRRPRHPPRPPGPANVSRGMRHCTKGTYSARTSNILGVEAAPAAARSAQTAQHSTAPQCGAVLCRTAPRAGARSGGGWSGTRACTHSLCAGGSGTPATPAAIDRAAARQSASAQHLWILLESSGPYTPTAAANSRPIGVPPCVRCTLGHPRFPVLHNPRLASGGCF
jgi:hypothetical protein